MSPWTERELNQLTVWLNSNREHRIKRMMDHKRDADIMTRLVYGHPFMSPAGRVAIAEFGDDAEEWCIALECGTLHS